MNRRQALKTGAAVAVTATLGFPMTAKADDSELLALEREFLDIRAKASAAEEKADNLTGELPDWVWGDQDGKMPGEGGFPSGDRLPALKTWSKGAKEATWGIFQGDKTVMQAVNRVIEGRFAKLEKHNAKIEAINNERGITAAENEAARLWKLVEKIRDKIKDTPANGLEGVAVKLRIADPYPGEPDQELIVSALKDTERLTGGAA
ncbi:MAG: hypothetical protein IIC55_10480 [Proteobacteria bacterium]|nr:hypothetical protein [Pseudomonadota bacterium]